MLGIVHSTKVILPRSRFCARWDDRICKHKDKQRIVKPSIREGGSRRRCSDDQVMYRFRWENGYLVYKLILYCLTFCEESRCLFIYDEGAILGTGGIMEGLCERGSLPLSHLTMSPQGSLLSDTAA